MPNNRGVLSYVGSGMRAGLPSLRVAADSGPDVHTMNAHRILLASLLLAGSAALAHAATSEASSAGATRRTSLLIATLDRDHDGQLSPAEIEHAPVLLRALDLDEDGLLTMTELRGGLMAGASHRPGRLGSGFTLAFALDANHDGTVQEMEVANAASSLRTLDLNGDGLLSPAELRFERAPSTSTLALAR